MNHDPHQRRALRAGLSALCATALGATALGATEPPFPHCDAIGTLPQEPLDAITDVAGAA
jgi:hypothetical protein